MPSQPVPPEHFFGRYKLVSMLANLFIGNDQCRIAILGAGGRLLTIYRGQITGRHTNLPFSPFCPFFRGAR
ncbi:hypothetical protein FIBSPDRAFT_192785 [Athelia psychrophila]|uniref:Uncharacterized protein n=1 Tax=Athelia psychrophila TaxID=1759441 RepID=A0A166SGH6_9AGAM|nr:hypothetical protein FIBSPDRAFT_192785 [Fibularhizoctonia sp. CBS 109695]